MSKVFYCNGKKGVCDFPEICSLRCEWADDTGGEWIEADAVETPEEDDHG